MTPEQRAELRRLMEEVVGDVEADNNCNPHGPNKGDVRKLIADWNRLKTENAQLGALVRASQEVAEEEAMPMLVLEALADSEKYKVTIAMTKGSVTIEATAPAAAHGYCGKGSTVAEAVRSLGEMMNKEKEAK